MKSCKLDCFISLLLFGLFLSMTRFLVRDQGLHGPICQDQWAKRSNIDNFN